MEKVIVTINGKSIGLVPSEVKEVAAALATVEKFDPKELKESKQTKVGLVTLTFVPNI